MPFDDRLSLADHLINTAMFLRDTGAGSHLIVAGFLHDVGHALSSEPHEEAGAAWLGRYFPPAVTEPIRLHVAARYFLDRTHPSGEGAADPQPWVALKAEPAHFADAVTLRIAERKSGEHYQHSAATRTQLIELALSQLLRS